MSSRFLFWLLGKVRSRVTSLHSENRSLSAEEIVNGADDATADARNIFDGAEANGAAVIGGVARREDTEPRVTGKATIASHKCLHFHGFTTLLLVSTEKCVLSLST